MNSLGSRHVSVITRDGTEYLLPNEQLIAQQVVNWSYSNNEVRLKLPVCIAYGADVRRAIALCQEAAAEMPRVLREPKPVCLVKGFGDSVLNLELRLWINDPRNGVSNVKSDVFLRLLDKFREQGIEIPQPELQLRTPSELLLAVRRVAEPSGAASPQPKPAMP